MERLFPDFRTLEPEEIYDDLSWPSQPEARPYTGVNMVTSVDGKATLGGKASAIGSKVDHKLMRRIRLAADGVMNGAGSLRAENVNPSVPREMEPLRTARGMSPQPTAIVVTATADLPLESTFFTSELFPRVVVTTDSAPQERVRVLEPLATVIRAGRDRVDLKKMMEILASDLGIRRLLVEGGPTLNAQLIEAQLVDELFWTVAPKLLGGAAQRTMVEGSPLPLELVAHLEMLSLHHHESELYLRYRFRR